MPNRKIDPQKLRSPDVAEALLEAHLHYHSKLVDRVNRFIDDFYNAHDMKDENHVALKFIENIKTCYGIGRKPEND